VLAVVQNQQRHPAHPSQILDNAAPVTVGATTVVYAGMVTINTAHVLDQRAQIEPHTRFALGLTTRCPGGGTTSRACRSTAVG
jgi:hypothetical protein